VRDFAAFSQISRCFIDDDRVEIDSIAAERALRHAQSEEFLIWRLRRSHSNRRPGVTALLVNERGEAATRGMFKKWFEKARRDAGVHFQLRDLRAKNATDTSDLAVAQKRLAHTSRAMTEHYVRSRQGELVAPLDRTKSKR
jgi:integrase